MLPTINAPDYGCYARAEIDSGVKILETAGSPAVSELWEMAKPHGFAILQGVASFLARRALNYTLKTSTMPPVSDEWVGADGP